MRNPKSIEIPLKPIKSLLFVRLGKLGDLMAASWLFKRVREEFPLLRLGLLTLPRSKELFRFNPDLDVLRLWRHWALPELALRERLRGWDLLMDLNDDPSRSSILALKLIKPKASVAFHNDLSAAEFEKTIPTLPKTQSHALERLAVAAKALGISTRKSDLGPVVYIPKGRYLAEKASQSQTTGGGVAVRVVALNLSAGNESRYWPLDKWIGLGRALLNRHQGVWLKILCAPKDLPAARQVAAVLGPDRLLPPAKTGLHDFLVAIAASDMLVSADTSAVHAASAFGVPVLGLYPEPSWNFVSWRPMGSSNEVLRSTSKEGIEAIPLPQVQAAALRLLKKTGANPIKTIQARAKELLV